MKNNYGIVVNKIAKQVANEVRKNADVRKDLLTYLYFGIPDDRRCAMSNVTYIVCNKKYNAKNDYLIKKGKLKTLDGMKFENFVYDQVPTVKLTVGKADELKVHDFDVINEKMGAMEKKMREDRKEFLRTQAKLMDQLAKAEKEKAKAQKEKAKAQKEKAKAEKEKAKAEKEKEDDRRKHMEDMKDLSDELSKEKEKEPIVVHETVVHETHYHETHETTCLTM